MSVDVIGKVRAARARSELLRAAASVRLDGGRTLALGGAVRPLQAVEIRQLEAQGNSADDWNKVLVADGFDGCGVRHTRFLGPVVLGRFHKHVQLADGVELASGLCHATVSNCVIGHDALVHNVGLLANYVVGSDAVLLDCGSVTCEPSAVFGNGGHLAVGPETGGREVAVYAEIDVETAATVAQSRAQYRLLREYAGAVAEYAALACCGRGIIERGAVLAQTPQVRNTYVGPFARIDNATGVSDCTLLSNEEEPARITDAARVSESILQWGSQVDSLAVVQHSVLTEHSQVERHGKVTGSLLGANTVVAEGEVTASLLGPFVACHHQALVIATVWPEGKGNVSHGASAGSNHTTRAPDQEFWPAEGLFLGLGVEIKFPVNLRQAPYSVLAAGVHLPPQKMAFPFSLVRPALEPSPGVSVAFNEIIPAWVLSDNLYALRRNEGKYRARNRARRADIECAVFRPDTVDLMRQACRSLEEVPQVKEVYTEADIPGLGKNYLREARRRAAISAYRFHTLAYALLGLKDAAQAALRGGRPHSLARLLLTTSDCPRWEQQRAILNQDFGLVDVRTALNQLPDMCDTMTLDVLRSRAKDDERGRRIIDDYAEVHVPATQDAVVRQSYAEALRLREEVKELIAALTIRPVRPIITSARVSHH